MSGFKEGASLSPYDEDDDLSGTDSTDKGNEDSATTDSSSVDDQQSASMSGGSESNTTDQTQETSSSGGLPWIYRRSGIHDDRKTRQIHLQEDTERRESDARSTLERQLGESIPKADLREAALRVGLEQLGEVADELRDWGYDHE